MLRPEVAAKYRLGAAGHTRLFVPRLGREVDLTKISLAEADELAALPGGFEWLRRQQEPLAQEATPHKKEETIAQTTASKRATKAKRGTGGEA